MPAQTSPPRYEWPFHKVEGCALVARDCMALTCVCVGAILMLLRRQFAGRNGKKSIKKFWVN